MLDDWLGAVLDASGTSVQAPATSSQLAALFEIKLPSDHIAVLARSNGLVLYDGYFRLFGADSTAVPAVIKWNEPDTWKFAWPDKLDEYFCFGDTVWGDQYAYRVADLEVGRDDVYFLDALQMTSRKLADTFDAFGERFLRRNASEPFDSVLRAARAKLGPIASTAHLTFNPHVLLGGTELVENLVKLDALDVMLLNGDLWSQLSQAKDEAKIGGLDVVEDENGRHRTRVRWVD